MHPMSFCPRCWLHLPIDCQRRSQYPRRSQTEHGFDRGVQFRETFEKGKKKHRGVTHTSLPTHPPSTEMPHYSSQCVAPGDEDEISIEDSDVEEVAARDRPEPSQSPPSRFHSLSTSVSELELEQGEALMKVKRLKREKDLEDLLPDPEALSSEDEELAPKKRKRNSKNGKPKGKGKKTKGVGLTQ